MGNTIDTSDILVNIQQETPLLTVVQPLQETIEVRQEEAIEVLLVDVGLQGIPGAQGPIGPIGQPLEFNLLTEEQKIELRGDVGNTSTNYTNLFNSVLLS